MIKKGKKVIYHGELFEVYERKKQAVKIYKPSAPFPELTMVLTSINNLQEVKK